MKRKICIRPGGDWKLKASPTEEDWKINAHRHTVIGFVVNVVISTFRNVFPRACCSYSKRQPPLDNA